MLSGGGSSGRSNRSSRFRLILDLARRYLMGRQSGLLRGTTRAALGSIALGTTAMVIAMALMTGYTQELQRKLLEVGAVQVVPQFFGGFDEDDLGPGDTRPQDLTTLDGVSSVSRVLYGQGSLQSADDRVSLDVVIRGVDPLPSGTIKGGFGGTEEQLKEDENGVPGVLLGKDLASGLGARIGDVMKLVAVSLEEDGPRFRYHRVRMTGQFATGYAEFDKSYLVLSSSVAGALGNPLVIYEVGVDDVDRIEQVREQAETMLGQNYLVSDWLSQNPNLFQALRFQKLLLFVTLGLIVVVSAFNVIATLIVLVRERMRDVGVLKALGLGPRPLQLVFVACGVLLGALGTAIGLAVGSVVAWTLTTFRLIRFGSDVASIYFIDYVPFQVQASDLLAIAGFCLSITFFASWLPAMRAARVQPAEALRYD